MNRVKITTFVPLGHAHDVRMALGQAGAGKIGEYTFCSYSVLGTGRFKAGKDTNPTIGTPGELTEVQEERIEMVCERNQASGVIKALKQAHPYEEVAYDIVALVEEEEL